MEDSKDENPNSKVQNLVENSKDENPNSKVHNLVENSKDENPNSKVYNPVENSKDQNPLPLWQGKSDMHGQMVVWSYRRQLQEAD
jgi:hypothetical protein